MRHNFVNNFCSQLRALTRCADTRTQSCTQTRLEIIPITIQTHLVSLEDYVSRRESRHKRMVRQFTFLPEIGK